MGRSEDEPQFNSTDCPFCAIVRGADPAVREVYRDARVVAFFPTEPATLGHTLVVPRQHIADIWALDGSVGHEVGSATLLIARAIRLALVPDGLNVIQSNGAAASQTVPHLHVHLVPRWMDDGFGRIWPIGPSLPGVKKDKALELIRLELESLIEDDQ